MVHDKSKDEMDAMESKVRSKMELGDRVSRVDAIRGKW